MGDPAQGPLGHHPLLGDRNRRVKVAADGDSLGTALVFGINLCPEGGWCTLVTRTAPQRAPGWDSLSPPKATRVGKTVPFMGHQGVTHCPFIWGHQGGTHCFPHRASPQRGSHPRTPFLPHRTSPLVWHPGNPSVVPAAAPQNVTLRVGPMCPLIVPTLSLVPSVVPKVSPRASPLSWSLLFPSPGVTLGVAPRVGPPDPSLGHPPQPATPKSHLPQPGTPKSHPTQPHPPCSPKSHPTQPHPPCSPKFCPPQPDTPNPISLSLFPPFPPKFLHPQPGIPKPHPTQHHPPCSPKSTPLTP